MSSAPGSAAGALPLFAAAGARPSYRQGAQEKEARLVMRAALRRMHRAFDPIAAKFPRVAAALSQLEVAMDQAMPCFVGAAPRAGRRWCEFTVLWYAVLVGIR